MAALTELQIRKALTKIHGSFDGLRDLSSYDAMVATAVGHSQAEREAGVKAVSLPTEEELRAALGDEDPMAQPREEALRILTELADEASSQVNDVIPRGEMAAWSIKEVSARAVKAGNPEPQDTAILQAEASMTGETLDQLADHILEKAESYRIISGKLAGFRRAYGQKIMEAKSPGEIVQILADARQSADRELFKVIAGL
jgi:hypothetical protein